ncbi:hypothetical protein EDB19DRAFT_1833250 [Suillus lakei]|nr:hypothetical protein EDB19DRAFT_1833250 [Suillus lakei]
MYIRGGRLTSSFKLIASLSVQVGRWASALWWIRSATSQPPYAVLGGRSFSVELIGQPPYAGGQPVAIVFQLIGQPTHALYRLPGMCLGRPPLYATITPAGRWCDSHTRAAYPDLQAGSRPAGVIVTYKAADPDLQAKNVGWPNYNGKSFWKKYAGRSCPTDCIEGWPISSNEKGAGRPPYAICTTTASPVMHTALKGWPISSDWDGQHHVTWAHIQKSSNYITKPSRISLVVLHFP